MANAATDVANVGTDTVYVFNQSSKDVKKFQVFTYREDSIPFTIVKEANELPVNRELEADYRDAVEDTVQNNGRELVLPDDFPIRSAAGAYLSPNTAKGYINQYLASGIGWMDLTTVNANKLVSGLMARLVPLVDIQSLISDSVIVVQYPDGSTQQYLIKYVFNLVNSQIEHLASPVTGSGTDQAGNPIPERAAEFAGRSFEDVNGAIGDWVEYARDHHVSIVGVAKAGGSMVCVAKSPTRYECTLRKP